PVVGPADAVGRERVDAQGDDRAAQTVRAAGERDLLRRPAPRGLAELRERPLVEREDEVGLGLDGAVEVVAERVVVEGDPGGEQVLLEHGLARAVREAVDQRLDELRPRGRRRRHAGTASWTKRSSGT